MNSSNERDFDALKITSVSNETTVTTNNEETLAAAAAPSVNVSVTDSHLFWRESSDGEFLEKLFENTLLSDSLGKKQDETSSSDFVVDELLAFDNIHLTYPLSTAAATSSDSVSSSTASATTGVGSSIHHQHHEQSSSSSSTPPPPASSSSSTSLSQQQQQQQQHRLSPPAAYVNNNNDPLLTLNSDLKDTITAIIETQQQENDRRVDKSTSASSTTPTSTATPTPATDQLIENLLTSSDLLISKIELAENNTNTNTNAEDDKIFKRPSADFILSPPAPAPPPTTPSQAQTKQSPPPNEITRTMTTAKKQIKALLRMKKDLDAESPNAATTDKPTTVKTKENKLNKQSTNTNQTASNSNNATTTTGKLKRSRRQQRATKMVNGGGGVQQADSPKSSRIIKQSLFDAAAANSGKKSVVDATSANGNVIKELIQPSKQAMMFKNRHSNIEPSTKKFASNAVNLNLSAASINPNSFLVSTTNQRSNSAVIDFDINAAGGSFEKALNLSLMPPSANSRRDEVDLDIKELSLLDLHSSEDDSTLDFSKRIVKKCIVPSLNSNNNNTSNTNVPTNVNRVQLNLIGGKSPNEKSNIFNEIISKRIKYSNPRVVSQQQQQQQPLAPPPPPPPPPLQQQSDESSTVQYITLVDGATPSTSLQIHQQQQQKHKKDEPVSYSDWAFSPPSPSNTKAQIKRKKKDPANSASPSVDSSKTPQSSDLVAAEQAANKSSLENDTLQHMKNLDLNNEFGRQQLYSTAPITSSSSNSSSSSNELLSKQLNLNDVNARNQLWNMLRTHTPADELVQRLGAEMHDKVTFWDLVQLKLKYSPANSHLKTIYDIIDDYTLLYSNMSSLLERFANEQTFNCNIGNKKNAENSSRSRSSSRNFRKQSTGK